MLMYRLIEIFEQSGDETNFFINPQEVFVCESSIHHRKKLENEFELRVLLILNKNRELH